eukprot:GHVQ01011661.1.p2 GENE.GHVQ01011661.1~~GHVQ01011661.1.p2  ORF type:complete len:113 (-),score=1.02 GHVQ01011661.1:36-374(-)
MSAGALLREVLRSLDTQVNTTDVKPEDGNIRISVAGDLPSLQPTYGFSDVWITPIPTTYAIVRTTSAHISTAPWPPVAPRDSASLTTFFAPGVCSSWKSYCWRKLIQRHSFG